MLYQNIRSRTEDGAHRGHRRRAAARSRGQRRCGISGRIDDVQGSTSGAGAGAASTIDGQPAPGDVRHNWAGNQTYSAQTVAYPRSVDELCAVVAGAERVRAFGTGHSFNDIADTTDTAIGLSRLRGEVIVDAASRSVSVPAGLRYGDLNDQLDDAGWGLANLASLPHVSVAGAVATGTHGSGDGNVTLSAAVREVELVTADGSVRTFRRGQPGFDGVVVSLGALGVVSRVGLDIEPSFTLRQDLYAGLSWSRFAADFDAILGAGYSVSVFLDWRDDSASSVVVKSRAPDAPDERLDARRVTDSGQRTAWTDRSGTMGPWHLRLPHFRLEHGPSHGAELQTEYLVSREHAVDALAALRSIGHQLMPALHGTEVRTMAADKLWLSPAYGRDTVGIHFTWKLQPETVSSLLPLIEERLAPFGARPHWGKLFAMGAADIGPLYPRFDDFLALRDELDPDRKFDNVFTRRVLDG